MLFHCNGIFLIQGNLPRVFPMFTLNYASFPIPYFNLLFFYWEWPSFVFDSKESDSVIFYLACVGRKIKIKVCTLCRSAWTSNPDRS